MHRRSSWRQTSWRNGMTLIGAVLALLGLASRGVGAERLSWHHGDSPYRALFKVTEQPSHRDAGYAVAVPVCGLGAEDGMDLYAFDQDGNPLRLMPLGKGAGNTALALVKGTAPCRGLCLYFGSKSRAPVLRKGFLENLTLDVRTLPEGPSRNWPEVEALLRRSESLGKVFCDRIEQSYNPVDSTDACILVFEGHLNIPRAGDTTLMIVTDDAGYLFVDDAMVLERHGRHYAADAARGECRKAVTLSAGPHRVRLVVVDFGGTMMALLGTWIDAKTKGVLPPAGYVQSGKTTCERVEARYRDAPMPGFSVEALSYIGYGGAQFTEVRLEVANGRESAWRFEDGARFKGASCTRVLPGLASRGVSCTQGQVTARGLVQISEALPTARSILKPEDVDHYTRLILEQRLEDIDAATLRGYLTFLSYVPLNEAVIPVCEAILADRKAEEGYRRDALVELSRAAARRSPEKARQAYVERLKGRPGKAWEASAREAGQFALFGVRDMAWAGEIVKALESRAERGSALPTELALDLALQQGDTAAARKHLEALLGRREKAEDQRVAVVRGNALRQRFQDLLKADFVIEAWEVLNEWSEIAPVDRNNGSLSLARARLWRRLGWLDGALGELDGAMLLDPLLPNLPEVEMERGRVLAEAGDAARAREAFAKVAREYPNHPLAAEAARLAP